MGLSSYLVVQPHVKHDSSNISFGWNHSTHRLIVNKLIKKYNMTLDEKKKFDGEIFESHCVQPDYDRKLISKHIRGHFADVDNLSNNPADAYYLAVKYTNKAMKVHKDGLYTKRDIYLSYATHFLMDALEPYHAVGFVERNKMDPIRRAHKNFENIAEAIQMPVLKSTTINELNTSGKHFFKDAFKDSMRTAKSLYERIEKNDYKNIVEIATLALDNTYKTTNLYFKMLLDKIK